MFYVLTQVFMLDLFFVMITLKVKTQQFLFLFGPSLKYLDLIFVFLSVEKANYLFNNLLILLITTTKFRYNQFQYKFAEFFGNFTYEQIVELKIS